MSKDEDNNNKYDGDNNNNEDAKPRVAIRYPTATLRLQGGSRSPKVNMRVKEETEEATVKNNTVILEDIKENIAEGNKSDNEYSKQGVFGRYTNCGYTSNRTTTTDMMSINTNNTAKTNNKTESDDSSNQNTRAAPNNINKEKNVTKLKLPNEIKALSGRKFIGYELTTYGDAFGPKKEGMI